MSRATRWAGVSALVALVVVALVLGAAGGVAWCAHVGGFLAGALLALLLRGSKRVKPRPRYVIYGG